MPLPVELTVDVRDVLRPIAVASGSDLVVLDHCSARARVVDLRTNESRIASIGENLLAEGAAISADGTKVFVLAHGGVNDMVQIWDLKMRTCRKTIRTPDSVSSHFVVDGDGAHLFVATSPPDESAIYRMDIEKGTTEEVFGPGCQTHATINWKFELIEPLAVSPDGKNLVIGAGTTGVVVVWNLEKRQDQFLCSLAAKNTCSVAAVSPDGAELVTAPLTVELWDFRSGKHIRELLARGVVPGHPEALAFSPDGKFLVAGFGNGIDFPSYLVIWRVGEYSNPTVLQCHAGALRSMSFLPQTNWVVTAGDHETVRIWNLDRLTGTDSGKEEVRKEKLEGKGDTKSR